MCRSAERHLYFFVEKTGTKEEKRIKGLSLDPGFWFLLALFLSVLSCLFPRVFGLVAVVSLFLACFCFGSRRRDGP